MEEKEIKRLLKITQTLCEKKNEADATDIYQAAGITAAEANTFIQLAEEKDLADVVEIDMCCGADYIIKGLTEAGLKMIEG